MLMEKTKKTIDPYASLAPQSHENNYVYEFSCIFQLVCFFIPKQYSGRMQRSIILFLCWISVYFVGRTIVGYGLLDGESTAMMRTLSLLKEVVRAMICLGCALMTSQSRTAAR